jgi:hypothetical protein
MVARRKVSIRIVENGKQRMRGMIWARLSVNTGLLEMLFPPAVLVVSPWLSQPGVALNVD